MKRRSRIMIVSMLAAVMLSGSGVSAGELGIMNNSGWEKMDMVKKYVSEAYSERS